MYTKRSWQYRYGYDFSNISLGNYESYLFLDLDGTARYKNPLAEQLGFEYLRALEQRGLLLVILNSGRAVEGLLDLSKDYHLASKIVAGSNGCSIIAINKDSNIHSYIHCLHNLHIQEIKDAFAYLCESEPGLKLIGTYGYNGPELIFSIPREKTKKLNELFSLKYKNLELTHCGSSTAHLHSKATSKGAFIEALADQLNIEKEKLLAAGDSDNDMSVVDKVGFMIAVANAQEELKAVSTYSASGEGMKGVIEGVDKYLIDRKLATYEELSQIKSQVIQKSIHAIDWLGHELYS